VTERLSSTNVYLSLIIRENPLKQYDDKNPYYVFKIINNIASRRRRQHTRRRGCEENLFCGLLALIVAPPCRYC